MELANHRLVRHAPALLTKLRPLVGAVIDRLTASHRAVCHSDLHERQFFISPDGTLTALIDFGKAAILDPLWDFGSFCYFHGPDSTSALLDGYATGARRPDLALIKSFSAAIALHHASRSRLPGKAHRLDVAARHVAML